MLTALAVASFLVGLVREVAALFAACFLVALVREVRRARRRRLIERRLGLR